MDAEEGESSVVAGVAELYPGLWVSGMSVQAALGGPRMGPIFGGMLLSGRRAAALIDRALADGPRGARAEPIERGTSVSGGVL
jgi:thiamine thiazole synthase